MQTTRKPLQPAVVLDRGHPHDVHFGRNAGAIGIYVLTGHGSHHLAEVPAGEAVAADFLEAASVINWKNHP